MNTFKLISLQIVVEEAVVDIELVDGLIINKEDEQNQWLIEAYTDLSYCEYFEKAQASEKLITIRVVISKKDNDPASFETKISAIKKMNNHVSTLFEGRLKRSRSKYAELLLEDLMQKGLSGESLLAEFKEKIISKPRLEEKSN